jgi:mono/diheme cytochrome c family protein
MRRARVELAACAIALVLSACTPESRDAAVRDKLPDRFGIGRAATPAELAVSDVDVGPDGAGLPAGSGTPEQGAPVFLTNCATCHGNDGEGKPPLYPQIIGGPRSRAPSATTGRTRRPCSITSGAPCRSPPRAR